jgi:hypothetical protein
MRSPSMLDYQRQLIIASLDDFTPNSTLGGFCGGQYGANADCWRSAVINFLCKCFYFELIELTHRSGINERHDVSALRNLLIYGDVENGMSVDVLWNALYFNGTKKLIEAVQSCGLHGWGFVKDQENSEFIGFLKKIFSK